MDLFKKCNSKLFTYYDIPYVVMSRKERKVCKQLCRRKSRMRIKNSLIKELKLED